DRFARHEKFFCEELAARAEREFGASKDREDRAVFGCSNGARFAVEMGVRHPDRFGHVFAFSSGGGQVFKAPPAPEKPAHFRLAAGTWEKPFHQSTEAIAKELRAQGVPVKFHSRVAAHDDEMWQEEFARAVEAAFPKR